MKLAALIPLLALAGCYDPGGRFIDRAQFLAEQAILDTPLRLPRQCDSACTLSLQDANVCILREGSIGVHAGNDNGIISEWATRYMFNSYRRFPKFQAAIIRDRAMSTFRIYVYSASQMNAFGVPYC